MKDKLTQIHETAHKILEEVGINLWHPEVLDIVAQKGIKISGQRAYFKPEQVMDWVAKAPRKFTIHARNSKYDSVIGGKRATCAPGYGCAQIIRADGSRRDALLADYIAFTKLTHQCEYFNMNGGILAQPADVPAHQSHLIMLYAAATLSDKCLLGIPGAGQTVQEIMDIMAVIFGGKEAFIQKPRILTLINTMSPLQIDELGLQSMLIAARHRQPMIISPVPATGTTGPISLAGTLAMATAEALAGIAVAIALDVEAEAIIQGIAQLKYVPGRLERVDEGQGFYVFVDYAHTPDALEQVLRATRAETPGRFITVFGCGGDRDAGKRPQMARTAERLADVLWLTSDNPRDEDPAAIIRDMRAGLSGGREVHEAVDRRAAIRAAIGQARPGDVVLVAGKGHEAYQEACGVRTPFSDRDVVRDVLAGAKTGKRG